MTEETENLVLAQLRALREDIAGMNDKLTALNQKVDEGFLNINVRMTAFEQKLDGIGMAQTAQADRLDHLESRLQRVERRLELSDS